MQVVPLRSLVVRSPDGADLGVARQLAGRADTRVVAEAAPSSDLEATLRHHRPDAVFLALPPSGPEPPAVPEALRRRPSPALVIVARDARHAARALEQGAVDYLVTPLTSRRLDDTMARLRARPASPEARGRGGPCDRYLAVRRGEAYELLDLREVRWAESARNYVRLHTERGRFLVRMTLSDLEGRLAAHGFTRIHRGTIVSVERIRRILPERWGDGTVELESGERLRMSRTYRPNLLG